MRSTRRIAAALVGLSLFLASGSAAERLLGSTEIPVLGLAVDLDTRPDLPRIQSTMTAVRDVPTGVLTVVGPPGLDGLLGAPSGALVKAELSGPSLGEGQVTVAGAPNALLELPLLRAAGEHLLANVRLEDAKGNVLVERDPSRDPIVITVIDELLVTQVTSRPLTLEEIAEKGIVIDDDNFTALNFTVALSLGSEKVSIDLPVVVPATAQAAALPTPPQFTRLRPDVQQLRKLSIPNLSLVGFGLRAPPELDQEAKNLIPEINGVIVIPGNIAFLNQFFSVILQATNAAPEGSGLVLDAARARIELPTGGDEIPDTGDDPLRIAETESGGVQEELPLLDEAGRDSIAPQATHAAEFLVEGLREGTHEVRFDIEGELFVPALGRSVPLMGRAGGVVQVKNPTFSVVLAHPDVVREGEEYPIFATVTNTSSTPANLFRLSLARRSLSGASLAEGEDPQRELDSLGPGDSASFEYRLVARTTGEVTGTVFLAEEGINGSFVLTTGVGDTGIPLSPDTLVLPQTVDYLPDDLVFAAVRLLGQAYSVSTAPGGTLPPEIPRIGRSHVFARAVKLAQSGLHVRFGETRPAAVQDLLLDYLGNDLGRLDELIPDDANARRIADDDLRAFDVLRRAAAAGENFTNVAGSLVGEALDSLALSDLLHEWALRFASRPAFLAFGAEAGGAPLLLELGDAEGNRLGTLDPAAESIREIPFAARLPLRAAGPSGDAVVLVASPQSPAYVLAVRAPEGADGIGLSLVAPDGDGLTFVVYPAVSLEPGGTARVRVEAGAAGELLLEIDDDGDGSTDRGVAPQTGVSVADLPPAISGVHQWGKGARPLVTPTFSIGDPIGRMLGVLFSEEVGAESAERTQHYEIAGAPGFRVLASALQPDRRLVFTVLDEPVGPFVARELAVHGVEDLRGQAMEPAQSPIVPDPDRGAGGRVSGQVLSPDGRPVPFASVKYLQPLDVTSSLSRCFPKDFAVSSFEADGQGRFEIGFVLQSGFANDEVCNPDIWLNRRNAGGTNHFKLEAGDPETEEVGRASTRVQFDGQHLDVKVIIRGFGAIEGDVFDENGNTIVGGDPGGPDELLVLAKNLSTGEEAVSFVDAEGFYAFPRSFEGPDGESFEAPSLPVGNVALLVVRPSDGFTAVTTTNLPAAGARVVQDLVMLPPFRFGAVSGRVLEADGATPAPNVLVQLAGRILTGFGLAGRTTSQGVIASTVSDANGAFRFENVPSGDIELLATRASTFEQAGAKAFLDEGTEEELVLVLPGGGGTVRGLVIDALGQPVPGAAVAGGPSLTEADEDGRFEIEGLPLGTFSIFGQGSESPSVGEIRVTTTGPDDVQEVVIQLEPVGSVTGSVFEADGTTPRLAQKVQLWVEPNRGVIAETFTGPDGRFAFDRHPLGRYSVRAIDPETVDGGMAFTELRFAGDARDADVVFRGLGEIEGRVVQDNGTPVIADVLIVHKAWRIVVDEGVVDNASLGLDVLEQFAQLEELEDSVRGAIERNRLNAGAPEFFFLVDETVALRSDELGPGGAVTGRFHFAGPAAGGPFTVAAFGPFLSPAEVRDEIPRTADPLERRVDVGDIVLEPATGAVRGTVYLPDGETPVGADVQVKLRSLDNSGSVKTTVGTQTQPVLPEIDVFTDENGSFEFPLVLRGGFVLTADTGVPDPAIRARSAAEIRTEAFEELNVRLYGSANGAVPKLPPGEFVTADLRLQDVAGVRARVLEPDGQAPVEGARVSLATSSSLDEDPAPAFTDPNGEVEFFPLIEGMFSLSASLVGEPRRAAGSGTLPVNPPDGFELGIDLVLGAVSTPDGPIAAAEIFGTVTGTVFRADGTPLENPTEVVVRAGGVQVLTSSGPDGSYVADNVPGGFFRVEAFEPLTARRGTSSGTLTSDGATAVADVTLAGLGTVTGEVLDNAGAVMLSGADVILMPAGDFSNKLVTRTDVAGVYTLPGVPLGPYVVKATDPASGLTGESDDVMQADGEIRTTDILLEGSGRIEGIVYAAGVALDAEGEPIDRAAPVVEGTSVTIAGGGFSQTVQTDAEGRFESGAFLRLGSYSLTARPMLGQDGATGRADLAVDGEVAAVALVLRGTGAVEGVVLDSTGSGPVAGASVTLASTSPFSSGTPIRITDADGRFAFQGVPVGEFALSVRTNLQVPALGATALGAIPADGAVAVFDDLRLEAAGSVVGRVVLSDGATPAEGAIVRLEGGAVRISRFADGTGRFLFEGIPLGDYHVSLLEPLSNGVAMRDVSIDANGDAIDLGSVRLDPDPPAVISSDPAADAVGVDPRQPIRVTFSEPIDLATADPRSFEVRVDGQRVPGAYAASDSTLRFTPDVPLPDLRRVTVALRGDRLGFEGQVLDPGLRDLSGLELVPDRVFSFTTGDSTAPAILSRSPAPGARDVPLSSVIRIELDEPIEPASLASFGLTRNGSPVAGSVNAAPVLGGRVFVFTPDAPLLPDTRYTTTLVGPLRDDSGNAMEQAQIGWSFESLDTLAPIVRALGLPAGTTLRRGSTVVASAEIAPESDDVSAVEFFLDGALVDTDVAEPYALSLVLDKRVGVAPVLAAVAVDEAGNRSNAATLALTILENLPPQVEIRAPAPRAVSQGERVDVVVAGSDDVGLARLSFSTAGAFAAGGTRALGGEAEAEAAFAFEVPRDAPTGAEILVEASATDSGGQVSSVGPVVLAVVDDLPPEVTIASPGDGGILEPGGQLSVFVRADDASGIARIRLDASGALAVSESRPVEPAESPASASFRLDIPPDIPPGATLDLTASAVDASGLEASDSVSLRAPDTEPPLVSAETLSGRTGVEPGEAVSIRVRARDNLGVTSVDLRVPGVTAQSRGFPATSPVSPTFTFGVPPDTGLGTELQVEVSARDQDENVGAAGVLTLIVADLTAPHVVIEAPTEAALLTPGAALAVRVRATDTGGVTRLTCGLDGAATGSAGFDLDPAEAEAVRSCAFQVPEDAPAGAEIAIEASATDASGNAATATKRVFVADVEPPQIVAITPADAAEDVAPDARVVLEFSESIDLASFAAGFELAGPEGSVTGSIGASGGGRVMTFTPAAPLAHDASYTIRVATRVSDLAGNALQESTETRFRVTADAEGPCLVRLVPEDGASGLSLTPRIEARFDEPLDAASATPQAARVTSFDTALGAYVSIGASVELEGDGSTLVLTPPELLALGTDYRVELLRDLRDAHGNRARSLGVCAGGADDGSPLIAAPSTFTTGTIAISSPEAGSKLIEGQEITLRATASPDLGVVRIDWFDDLGDIGSGEAPDFARTYVVPTLEALGGTQLTIGGTAQELGVAIPTVGSVVLSANGDADADGLSNGEELALATDPFDSDSDDDGLGDADDPLPLSASPLVTGVIPADEAVGVSISTTVRVEFSQPIDPATLDSNAIFLAPDTGDPVSARLELSRDGRLLTLTPSEPLALATLYHVAATTAIRSTDGAPLQQPFASSFTTGDFAIATPRDGEPVTESSELLLEARASAALGVASVVFSIGGAELPPLASPPFRTTFVVPSASEITSLAIAASARDAGGAEIARDQVSVPVRVALRFVPKLVGLPPGGSSALWLRISSPTETPIAIALEALAEGVVDLPEAPLVLPAGATEIAVPVSGRAEGAVSVVATSELGLAGAVVVVTPEVSFEDRPVFAAPAGAAALRPARAAQLLLPGTSRVTLSVPILDAPTGSELAVENESSDAGIVTVLNAGPVPRGGTSSLVSLDTGAPGVAFVLLRAGTLARELKVVVGAPSAGDVAPLFAVPAGATALDAAFAGRVAATVGGNARALVPLLSAPATGATPVTVTSSDPNVARISGEPSVGAGETAVVLDVAAGEAGTAILILRAGDDAARLEVVVGAPAEGLLAPVFAVPAGATALNAAFAGRALVPVNGSTLVEVPLLSEPAAGELPVSVTTSDASIAQVPGSVRVAAGQTSVTFAVEAGEAGTARLTLRAGDAAAQLEVVVGDPPAGLLAPGFAVPSGTTVLNVAFAGRVAAALDSSLHVAVPLLSAPAATETRVDVSSSNPAVADVTASVRIDAGQTAASLEVTTGNAGRALLTLRTGDEAASLEVVVGAPAPGVLAPVLAVPAGVAVLPPGTSGTLYLDVAQSREVLIPLRSPAAAALLGEVTVEAESRDPSLASVTPDSLTLAAGQTGALFTVTTGEGEEEVLIVFRIGNGDERALRVIVGLPPLGEEPFSTAPVVGVEVESGP